MCTQIANSTRAKTCSAADGSSLSWEGVLFIPPISEGEESARELLRLAGIEGLESAIRRLKGLFFAVYDDGRGNRHAFVDNCGYYCAYRSSERAAADFTSFLEPPARPDELGMLYLLREGVLYFDRTPIEGVRRIGADEIWSTAPNEPLSLRRKGLGEIFSPDNSCRPIEEIVRETLESFRGRKIAIDLSGGLDTRLTLGFMLQSGLPFTAFSHGLPGHSDIEIPKALAEAGGFEYRPVYPEASALGGLADELFAGMEFLNGTLAYYPDFVLNQRLVEAGFDLRLQSGSAVLLRDFWSFSDWPFYRRKRPNFKRLYNYRMRIKPRPELFAGTALARLDSSFDSDLVRELERRFMRTPAHSANEACAFEFRYHASAGRSKTFYNRTIPTYSLYCDRELMHSAANMPFSEKHLNRFFRRIVSAASPEIARIKTDRGQSLRDSQYGIAADRARHLLDLFGRLYRKGRYYITERPMRRPLLPSEIDGEIRALPHFPGDLEILQRAGYINPGLSLEQVPTGKIGNIIAAGELLRRIGY